MQSYLMTKILYLYLGVEEEVDEKPSLVSSGVKVVDM